MPELAWAESTLVAQYPHLWPSTCFPCASAHFAFSLTKSQTHGAHSSAFSTSCAYFRVAQQLFNARTRWQIGPLHQLLSARLRLCLVSPFYGPALSAVSLSSSPLDADRSDVAAVIPGSSPTNSPGLLKLRAMRRRLRRIPSL